MSHTEAPIREAIERLVSPTLFREAKDLCYESDLHKRDQREYVRAQAELIVRTTPGLNMDEYRDVLMKMLVERSPEEQDADFVRNYQRLLQVKEADWSPDDEQAWNLLTDYAVHRLFNVLNKGASS